MRHKVTSIRESLIIDIEGQFINDYMNFVLLGVTKKVINYLINGKTKETRLSSNLKSDKILISMNKGYHRLYALFGPLAPI